MIASPLFSQLEQAKNGLEDAQIAYCGAVVAHAEAKRALELAAAQKLCDGLEGANKEGREARLRLELATLYGALGEAEDALTDGKCALELARLEWDLARYSVRVMEADMAKVAA
jgi:hypothetical protein